MTTLREAAQQALEALEASGCLVFKNIMCRCSELCGSYTAAQHLRAALAQQDEPAQEPVAWRYKPIIGSSWSLSDDGYYISCRRDKGYIVDSLYTAPPQRLPLTEEEIYRATGHCGVSKYTAINIARAVERAHGIGEQS